MYHISYFGCLESNQYMYHISIINIIPYGLYIRIKCINNFAFPFKKQTSFFIKFYHFCGRLGRYYSRICFTTESLSITDLPQIHMIWQILVQCNYKKVKTCADKYDKAAIWYEMVWIFCTEQTGDYRKGKSEHLYSALQRTNHSKALRHGSHSF